MHLLVAELLRGAEHRLDDELRRDLAREAEQDAGLDHRLGEEREVGGPGAGDRRDRVHRRARARGRPRRGGRAPPRRGQVRVVGVRAGAEPGDPLVHGRRGVRHRAHDGDAGREPLSMRAVGIAAATESTVCSGVIERADLAEERLDVLGLDGDDDERGAGRRLVVRERRLDAVALAQLGDTLGAACGRGDLARLAPAGREQAGDQRLADPAGAEDRDLALVDAMAGVYCGSSGARFVPTRGRAALDPCTRRGRGRAAAWSRNTLASPCHSSYGASSSAVSPSTQRRRARRGA